VRRIAGVIVLAAAAYAFADSSTAERAVAEAQTRAANNDFVGAAAKYREAFKADPRPDLMCNVGVAYYKAKDLPKAQRYLDQCLSIGTSLDRAFIDKVKAVLVAVESALAAGNFTPVDLLVQPPAATTSIEGVFDEPILGSRRVWVPFGKYKLTVHAEGHVDEVIDVDAKDRTAIPARFTLEPAPPPIETGSGSAQGSGSGSDASAAGSGSAIAAPQPPPPPRKPSLVPPIVATAASVGLGVVGVGLFVNALDYADQAGKANTRPKYDDLVETARSRQHLSWVFGGVAGVGAVVSGILWYRYASAPHVEVLPTASGGAITLSGRW